MSGFNKHSAHITLGCSFKRDAGKLYNTNSNVLVFFCVGLQHSKCAFYARSRTFEKLQKRAD